MKRMLAQKFIDYVKNLFGKIGINEASLSLRSDVNLEGYNLCNVEEINTNSIVPADDNDNANIYLGTINTLTANALNENPQHCGAIFQPINKETDFEVASNLHASNLGTIARGYFKVKAGRTIAAGTAIYQTSGQALHDAILAGDADDMPYTHLLCKVKGGAFFWLTMNANDSDHVTLSSNIELTAGMDCYVISAVQSSSLAA